MKPRPIEETTESGIILPTQELAPYQAAQTIGQVIEIAPDAYKDHEFNRFEHTENGTLRHVLTETQGYSEPFCHEGDWVMFNRHSGQQMLGMDGEEYRQIRDTDVLSVVDPSVKTLDFEQKRTALGGQ